MLVAGSILTTGRTAAFLLDSGASYVSTKPGNPSISVNGGSPVTLTGAIYCSQFPFVFYPLPSTILSTDTVTWSASPGWVTSGVNSAPAASGAGMTNLVDAEMFPLGAITMPVGVNQWALQPFVQTIPLKNYRKICGNFSVSGGVASGLIQNRGIANGIDSLCQPGVRGNWNVTWDDYSPGRDKLAWLSAVASGNTTITNVGPKQTILVEPSFTRYRQTQSVQPASSPANDGLASFLNYHDGFIHNILVTDPYNDPDDPHITSDYFRTQCAGSKVVRFMQAGNGGVFSNVAAINQCQQTSDFGYGISRSAGVQVTQVEPISGGHITIDGTNYPIVDGRTAFGDFGSQWACGRFTTKTPHPFADRQRISLVSLVNTTFNSGGTPPQLNGLMIAGSAGNKWATATYWTVWVYPVDSTHFDAVWFSGVNSSGTADVVGVQLFDTTGTNSRAVALYTTQGAIPWEEQLQVAAELGAVPWINIGECFSSQCSTDVGNVLATKWLALEAAGIAPEHLVLEWSNENWNFSWTSSRVLQVIQRLNGGIGVYKAEIDMAAKYLTLVKNAFDAVGLGHVVKRGIFWQWSVPQRANIVLAYAKSKGYTFEAGGDAPYLGILESLPAHACDGLDFVQLHDLTEWMLKYSSAINVANVGARTYLHAYYPDALYLGYEAALDNVLPFGGNSNQAAKVRDFYYHPRMHRTSMLAYWVMQGQGYDYVAKYNISHSIGINPNCYSLTMVDGQPAGMGLSNTFTAGKPANVNQDWVNESPALLAYQDWIAQSPTPPPSLAPSASDRATFSDLAAHSKGIHVQAFTAAHFTDSAVRKDAYKVSARDFISFSDAADGGLTGTAADSATFTDVASMALYFGRYRRGDSVELHFNAISSPDFAPIAVILDAGNTQVASMPMPTLDPFREEFVFPLFISSSYSLGNFQVYFYYTVAGVPAQSIGSFDVIAGGDSGGVVMSLHSVDRPEARSIIAQLSSGRLVLGSNPAL